MAATPGARTWFAPAGLLGAGDGRYHVTVKGHATGPAVGAEDAMTIAKWLNEGGYAEIELELVGDTKAAG